MLHKAYRVPPSATNPLNKQTIQVNHCRMPDCDNYGVPAKTENIKPGPNENGDKYYTVASTNRGRVPSIKCKCCGENPTIKSNQAIVSEIDRLSKHLKNPDDVCCPDESCDNHNKSVCDYPKLYTKRGYRHDNNNPIRQCKDCKTKFTIDINPSVFIRPHNQHLLADVYSRVINKSAVRRTLKGVGSNSKSVYYSAITFIEKQCNHLSGNIEQRMRSGDITLPKSLSLATDIQEYRLNWTDRLDKRNPVFSAIGTVDNDSKYLFAMDVNYDAEVDTFKINQQSAINGDLSRAEAFRQHAQYWLVGDEYKSGRANSRKIGLEKSNDIIQQIQEAYSQAQSREDIEDKEMWKMNPELHNPKINKGMQVHIPYTAYAHFFIVQNLFKGAGVENIQYSMDCESMFRASFLCAFKDEISQGKAHGFYIKHQKYLTVDERKYKVNQARKTLTQFKATLAEHHKPFAKQLLMHQNINNMQDYGKWSDKWAVHPSPTMNEPDKMVCCLTPTKQLSATDKSKLYLNTSIAAIDNIFQLTRRQLNALERPIGTSSGYNTVWNGYAPYNPKMVQKYLNIFRTTHNYCNQGQDKQTPAMRLGLTDRPMTYDDVLWPGQVPPQAPVKKEVGYSPIEGIISKTKEHDSKHEQEIIPPMGMGM